MSHPNTILNSAAATMCNNTWKNYIAAQICLMHINSLDP